MNGVGDILAPRIIGEIGDIRGFHSGKALVAFAGIDAPPYQSGTSLELNGTSQNGVLPFFVKRDTKFIQSIKTVKPTTDAAVYEFVVKKGQEGKPKKVANIAGLNKFLRIYYARVLESIRRLMASTKYCRAISTYLSQTDLSCQFTSNFLLAITLYAY